MEVYDLLAYLANEPKDKLHWTKKIWNSVLFSFRSQILYDFDAPFLFVSVLKGNAMRFEYISSIVASQEISDPQDIRGDKLKFLSTIRKLLNLEDSLVAPVVTVPAV